MARAAWCTDKAKWRVGVDKLQKKCGSKQARKYFAEHMRETVGGNHLPDYRLELENDFVTFYLREAEAPKPTVVVPPAPAKVRPKTETPARKKGIFVSSAALERLKALLPGSDVHWLETEYCKFFVDKDPAWNEDARFLKWAPNYYEKLIPAH